MESLIEQMKQELHISEAEARSIIEMVVSYVEEKHPLLSELSQDLVSRVLGQPKNT